MFGRMIRICVFMDDDVIWLKVALRVVAAAGTRHPEAIVASKEALVGKIVEIGRSPVMQGKLLQRVSDTVKSRWFSSRDLQRNSVSLKWNG